MLSGEYAVLAGAPALVAAVNRCVRCTVTPRERGDWRFVSTGFTNDVTLTRQQVFCSPPNTIAGVVRQMASAQATPEHLHLAIDSSACYLNDVKLGIGSSAATVAAVATAFAHLAGKAPQLAQLMDIHAAFQGGGSGLDVAAAVTGGVIRFQDRQAQPATLPAGLQMLFVFCGRGTRTSELLAKFDAWRDGNKPSALKYLAQAAGEVADCTANAGLFVDALDEYAYVLERFDQIADLGIFGAGHRQLRQLAAPAGVVYKPCGAGGDDVGMATATDVDALARFKDAVLRARPVGSVRFELVDMEWAADGVQVRTT